MKNLILLFLVLYPFTHTQASECYIHFVRLLENVNVDKSQATDFLSLLDEKTPLPVKDFSSCGQNCLEYTVEGHKNLLLRFHNTQESWIDNHDTYKTLNIGLAREYNESENLKLIKNWLIGHVAHPSFSVAKGQPLYGVEKEIVNAMIGAKVRGDKRFLAIGPGLRHSKIVAEFIKETQSPGVHFIVTDKIHVLDMFAEEISERTKTEIIKWHSKSSDTKHFDITELIKYASNQSVAVITTIGTLKSQLLKAFEDGIDLSSVNSIIYDQAHHSVAYQTRNVLEELFVQNPSVYMAGITPSPFNAASNIVTLFDHKLFWSYFDNASDYLAGKMVKRESAESILQQLNIAMAEGELTPLGKMEFIPAFDVSGKQSLYLGENNRYEINDDYYPQIIEKISSYLTNNLPGVIVVNSIEEANNLTNFIKQNTASFLDVRIEAIHSKISEKERIKLLKKFKNGEVKTLVTVGMLDESFEFSHVQYYIDFGHYRSARQFLQRLNTVLKIHENKESVDVVSILDTSENMLEHSIEMVELMTRELPVQTHNSSKKPSELNYLERFKSSGELRVLKTKLGVFWAQRSGEVPREDVAKAFNNVFHKVRNSVAPHKIDYSKSYGLTSYLSNAKIQRLLSRTEKYMHDPEFRKLLQYKAVEKSSRSVHEKLKNPNTPHEAFMATMADDKDYWAFALSNFYEEHGRLPRFPNPQKNEVLFEEEYLHHFFMKYWNDSEFKNFLSFGKGKDVAIEVESYFKKQISKVTKRLATMFSKYGIDCLSTQRVNTDRAFYFSIKKYFKTDEFRSAFTDTQLKKIDSYMSFRTTHR